MWVCGLTGAYGAIQISPPALPNWTVSAPYSQTLTATGCTLCTWSFTGALPTGLSLNAVSGQLAGTPSTANTFAFTVIATDINMSTGSQAYAVVIHAAPHITTAGLPGGVVGSPYAQTVGVTGGTPPYVFSISAGALPAGLTLNPSTGAVSGTPTAAGSSTFTVSVTDTANATASQAYSLVISTSLTITTQSLLASGTATLPYSQALTATGGTPPYSWAIASGTVPPGISLNPSNGTLSGTPTTAGKFTFVAQVTDTNMAHTGASFTINIAAALAITTTSPLPNGTVGVSYSQILAVSGGTPPYTWALASGALPMGIVFNASTGALSGTPQAAGDFTFAAQVTDSNMVKASAPFAVTITPPPLTITTPSPLPNGTVGLPYSVVLAASGGTPPYTWAIGAGALPGGLSLNPTTGALAGTPSSPLAGTVTFVVTDHNMVRATATLGLTINPAALTINTQSPLPAGTVGLIYSVVLLATGGTPPYNWTVSTGPLPAGLGLNPDGTLAGTPTTAGNYTFIAQVSDTTGAKAIANFAVNIKPPSLTITTPSPLPTGNVGSPYSATLAASGGTPPYIWALSSGSVPAGLTLSPSGNITGTPSANGTSNFTVQVNDSAAAQATAALTLTIGNPKLVITTSSPLPDATAGAPYSQTLAASGGAPPYSWSIASGSLPAGLSLNASTGAITGTPTTAGSTAFTAQVADSGNGRATAQLALTVGASTLGISTAASLPQGAIATAYSLTLTAIGGTPPYTWSITAGSLPAGLNLDGASGNISGTPSAEGSFTFNLRVTDAVSNHADQLESINVSSGPPPVPTLSFGQLPATSGSVVQIPIDLVLSASYEQAVTGQISLSFTPDAIVPKDDPAIQFSNGGRTANFTIPAGTTHAVFSGSSLVLQTGSVAGTLHLSVTSSLSGGNLSNTITVARAAPLIGAATVIRSASSFQIQVTGFSNSRDLTSAHLHFTAAAGQVLQTSDLTVDLNTAATQWFSGDVSAGFGGQFLLVIPFTVDQGSMAGLSSAGVQLQNAQGASSSVTASF